MNRKDSRCLKQSGKNRRTWSQRDRQAAPRHRAVRVGGLCFLALVFLLSASGISLAAPGKRTSAQPDPEKNRFTIMGAYGRIRGVIDWKGKTRMYVKPAQEDTVYAFDSEDLQTWTKSKKPHFPTDMALIQVGDRVFGYTEEGGSAYLWNEFNPDKGCRNKLGKMYEWKLDGTLAPSHTEKGWIQLGRVRGYRSQEKGGWGDDRTEHPDIKDFPPVKKAFQGTPYDAEAWLQDRRGVSLHTSKEGRRWTSRILLDPKNVNLPGFRGWKMRDSNGIADFFYYYRDDIHYEGGWEGKNESVNVYRMKEKDFDRLFERT